MDEQLKSALLIVRKNMNRIVKFAMVSVCNNEELSLWFSVLFTGTGSRERAKVVVVVVVVVCVCGGAGGGE